MRLPVVASLIVVLAFASAPSPLVANPCEIGVEPAATLLLPYFEVDLEDPEGITTLLSINNAHSEAVLTNVTFWTDWGVPTVNFPVFLTGFDVVTMNIGVVFRDGFLPITSHAGGDPSDTVSPHGTNPEWDGDFPECSNFLPLGTPGEWTIPAVFLDRMRQAHSGQPDNFGEGTCSSEDHGDGLMRGYVTIDTVNRCDLAYPSEEGYFADGGTGIASNSNQLFGDFYYVHPAHLHAQGDSLVHIQAFDGVGDGGAWQDGDQTFYGKFVGRSAVDNREPLPSVFGARYMGDFGGGGGTDLVVWRDTNSPTAEPVPCGTRPTWWPLTQSSIFDFDEEENVLEACNPWGFNTVQPVKLSPPPPPEDYACLRLASQRLPVAGENDEGGTYIGLHDAGWLRLDLNPAVQGESQAWVMPLLSNSGRFSVGLPAAALHSACDGRPDFPF